jgi:periplasmic divalent cation tolerance protein
MQSQISGAFLYSTWPDAASAEGCARALVQERLAACANILGGIKSIYRWENAVETADEIVVIFKTTKQSAAAAVARIIELHPYDVPVVAELSLSEHSAAGFLQWLNESVG